MLVLGRKVDEKVNLYVKTTNGLQYLGFVMLVELYDDKARIGFELDERVQAARDEIDENRP